MICKCLGPLLGVMFASPVLAPAAYANPSPLPAGDYPPHTRITHYPTWSNQDFDCNFGWYCDGNSPMPFVHIMTEDQLHRTGGWATWGEWHGDEMGFELYLSVYADGIADDGMPHPAMTWNEAAAVDEQTMLVRVQDAQSVKTIPTVLPEGVTGGTFAYYLNRPFWHTLFLTAWWGTTHEIEAAAVFTAKQKWQARHYLIQQVRAAILATQEGA